MNKCTHNTNDIIKWNKDDARSRNYQNENNNDDDDDNRSLDTNEGILSPDSMNILLSIMCIPKKECIHITFQRRSIRSQIYSDGIHSIFQPIHMQHAVYSFENDGRKFKFFFLFPSENGGEEEIFFLNAEVDF